jgi:mRNA-degrading endonuclease RelE of RelBE toxin-antitoxin system
MFTIEFTDSAVDDLRHFRKHHQRMILDSIQDQLLHEPVIATRNRKPLQPNDLAQWELRVGSFRVFYDISAEAETNVVTVKAIGKKEHNSLYIRGQEYRL